MTLPKPSSLEELEAQVMVDTEARNSDRMSLVEKLLNQYLTGFTRLSKFTLGKENEWEYAGLLLATRGFNSLRCAFDIVEKGYYSQAAMFTRSALEDWLTAIDCDKNRKTVEAVVKGEYELGKGELSYSDMIKRLSQKTPETASIVQHALSAIAYARRLPPGTQVGPDKKYLMLGQYDNKLFLAGYQLLLIAAVGMLDFLHRLLGTSGEEWWQETQPTVEAANTEIARISQTAEI